MTKLTVRQARASKGMTQDVLAAKSGVDQTYISMVERLRRLPSVTIQKRLAKALRIAHAKLLFSARAAGDQSVPQP